MGRTITDRVINIIVLLLFGGTILLPVILLIVNAINSESMLALTESTILKALLTSLLISFSTATISTVTGTALAFLLTKTNLPLARLIKLISLLPLFLPPYILAVAWSDVFLYLELKDALNNVHGVVFIFTVVYTPIAIFVISGSMANINRSVEEAGVFIGSYWFVFTRIVLPLIRPALLSSFSLIFVLSISEFTVPSYLSVSVLTTEIFTQFTAFYNYSAAISQSILLIVICLLLIYPERAFLTNASFMSFGKKGLQLKTVELRSPMFFLFISITYLAITDLLPLVYLIFQSIGSGVINLTHAVNLLKTEILNSAVIALEGALLLLFFGYAFAKLSNNKKWKCVDFILLSIFAIPSTVIGIALIRFFNTPTLNFIYGSSLIVLIAWLARFVFVSQKILSASLRQIPDSYDEAARLMGVSGFVRFIKIQLPLVSEGVFNAFCICFLFCLCELGASIMVYPPGTSLLPVKVFTIMANSSEQLVNSMIVVVLTATLLIILVLLLIKRLLFKTSWR